jgi:murein DD-endopeptidase MepM/ murein hydrolase activator NlpD
MAMIIENQYVSKRHKSSGRHSNKSAHYHSGFMSHFNQNPVRIRKRHNSSFTELLNQVRSKKENNNAYQKIDYDKPRKSGFSFSLPSPMTAVVVIGIVVFALIALKWEGIKIEVPESFAIDPNIEDLALGYAQNGVPGIPLTTAEKNFIHESEIIESLDTSPDLLINFAWSQYRVMRGDSVSKIAEKFGVSIGAIIASNDIKNARKLPESAVLRIPNIDGIPHKVKKGDSLTKIASFYKVPLDVILDVNDIKTENIREGETVFIPGGRMNDVDLRLSMGDLFRHPLSAWIITSRYGMRKDPISGNLAFHTGIDLRADTGTPVYAAMDGVISVVGNNRIYGQHILISHDNGYKTFYAHLSAFSVKQGEKVSLGKKIGAVGNTGYSTGPHLHFGIYNKNGKNINPLDLVH